MWETGEGAFCRRYTQTPQAVDRFFRQPVISKFETGEDPLNCYCQPGLIDL
jgi:hypothetical protein